MHRKYSINANVTSDMTSKCGQRRNEFMNYFTRCLNSSNIFQLNSVTLF